MKRKIFLTYIILILVSILTTVLLCLTFLHTSYDKNIMDNLLVKSDLINKSILLKHEKHEKIIYHELSQKYGKELNCRVTFFNDQGEVLSDSMNNSIIFSNKNKKLEVLEAMNNKTGMDRRLSEDINKKMMYIALPVIQIGIHKLITRVGIPLDNNKILNKAILTNVLVSIIIGIIVSLFIGYSYTCSITKPINELTLATTAIALGNFGKKVNISTKDEIERLANNFNYMTYKVKDMIEEVEDKNMEMYYILTSMSEGVLAIDSKFNIILINPLARSILELEEKNIIGFNIFNFIKNKEITNIIKECLEYKKPERFEVENYGKGSRFLKISISPISDGVKVQDLGVVILLEDITEFKRLENVRTEFVANVSHELKTPLTIISGFVETLIIEDINDEKIRKKFLNIIDSENKRLIDLIEKLILISKIEAREQDKNLTEYERKDIVNLYDIVKELYDMFEVIINKNNISFKINVSKNLQFTINDKILFKQMLVNLIDNSIKYNIKGGKITIVGYKKDNNVIIKIRDSGKGIPKKDTPRIFERFYRVEKGRARKDGGSGLGLSMVKHIVNSFGGEIKVKSKIGVGSEFIVKIPIC
ncbi:ATP-binding protein [Clostridium cochlearium]|uniref:ATP-binding protein n=1 Tax=Clostridium cochlearium TaxID=1494 RepID=UPI001EDEE415|nr:ATP-binding protein [Clostridium cochlearium]MBV1820016.1 cell wall metabolism sensor histidine kinase WalK [Bacteroidales bacterium MSK.15.36]MCG4571248.1 cell wall metabolism sensor histidine kinase WalK [Clostridium cochlearium]